MLGQVFGFANPGLVAKAMECFAFGNLSVSPVAILVSISKVNKAQARGKVVADHFSPSKSLGDAPVRTMDEPTGILVGACLSVAKVTLVLSTKYHAGHPRDTPLGARRRCTKWWGRAASEHSPRTEGQMAVYSKRVIGPGRGGLKYVPGWPESGAGALSQSRTPEVGHLPWQKVR